MIALAAAAASLGLILLLCRNDPKRRRALRQPGDGYRPGTRRLLAVLACAPGAACLAIGNGAAFFVWLGLCGVAGWLTSMGFAGRTVPGRHS